ncbi:hypothetical protein DICVIV_02339 [Dictyocaulus viviparus]|uniref:Uncharacterized protein n=1 Tax=Dictyocaulus viviparus TaxID=29172 RepID=A0A0D8YA98_DICVI|nr:hypothetical protein DICVIV_02339 [Dictyocaulus viviparus]
MDSDSSNFADIRALLSSEIPVEQSKGLSRLLSRLELPFHNAKDKVTILSLLFDGFTEYGDILSQWCFDAVPHLINKSKLIMEQLQYFLNIMTIEEVNIHIFVKLCGSETRRSSRLILIRLLLQLSSCLSSTCLEILRKCKQCSDLLVSELLTLEFDRSFPIMRILIFGEILSREETAIIVHHISTNFENEEFSSAYFLEYVPWKYYHQIIRKFIPRQMITKMLDHCSELSQHELLSLELTISDVFDIADNLQITPRLLMNKRSELSKSWSGLIPNEELTRIKHVVVSCQVVTPLKVVVLKADDAGFMNKLTYMEYVANSSIITMFIKMWISNLDVIETCGSSVTFSIALLPYCGSNLEICCNLIFELLKRLPAYASSTFLFLTSLYAKPFFQVDKLSILRFMRGVLIHRSVAIPALNFLSILCRRNDEERNIAFSLIVDLVSKFPSLFDSAKKFAIPEDSDPLDLLKEKLKLMETLCVSTHRSDELLPSLSSLLRKDGEVVGAAISVVITLCKEEILDVNTVRKQLARRVRQPGFEVALKGYCDILATITSHQEHYDDSVFVECVQELFEITQLSKDCSSSKDIRGQAWVALSYFDNDLLKSTIPIPAPFLIEQFLGLSQTERKGIYCNVFFFSNSE